MLSHYARLKAWIPFYKTTLDSITQKPLAEIYAQNKIGKFSRIKVAKNLYISKVYQDSIFNRIKDTDLRDVNGNISIVIYLTYILKKIH